MKNKFFNALTFSLPVLGILLIGSSLGFSLTTFAGTETGTTTDPCEGKIQVKLQEPITGDPSRLVYHFQKCIKNHEQTILRCNNTTAEYFKQQCYEKNPKTKKEELAYGKAIKVCKNGTTDLKQCPEDQKYKEAWLYALVKFNNVENKDNWSIVGRFPWDIGQGPPLDQDVKKVFGTSTPEYDAIQDLYTVGNCQDAYYQASTKKLLPGSTVGDIPFQACKNANTDRFTKGDAIYCNKFELICGESGVGLLEEVIGTIYKWVGSFIGLVAVLVIVMSGIQISAAQGDSAKVDAAKHRIMQSITGLVLLFLSGLLLYTINPSFFTAG